jgi:predicted phage terminase large subunit-like protein
MSNLQRAHIAWKEWSKVIQSATTTNLREPAEIRNTRFDKARADYDYFVNYYFPHYVTDPCADFHIRAAGRIAREDNIFAILEWPREHAKSVHADIFIPMWLIARGELRGMILVGKNSSDACSLLSDLQAELQFNQRFINDFGKQVREGTWEEGEFITNDGIGFTAVGRGQSPRGIRTREKRPNYCVVDDIDDDEIINNQDRVERVVDWLLGSLYGALDIRSSKFVMVGNRIHPKSILAHVVGDIDDKPKRKGIYHSRVMATIDGTFTGEPSWPQKYSSEQLQQRFERMGYFVALREYFHQAVRKGKVFKSEWIRWGRIPELARMDHIIAYFDPSYKAKTTNDFKAIKVWGKKGLNLYCIDAFVKQTGITEAVRWLYDYHESLSDNVIVDYYMEDVFLQDMFFEDFAAEAELRGYYLPIRGDKRAKPDKVARIMAIAPLWERGLVTYDIRQKKNQHMITGIDQTLGFQKGASIHDDGPDADEGAIWLLQKRGRVEAFEPRIGARRRVPDGW